MRRCWFFLLSGFFLGAGSINAQAADSVAPLEQIEVTGIHSRSTLNRFNGLVETRFELHLHNNSEQYIEPPLHVAMRFSGDVDPATTGVMDAMGGFGEDPYGTFYLDLSGLIGGGLAPGESVMQPVTYYREAERTISYELEAYGIVNQPPQAAKIPEFTGIVGEELTFGEFEITDPEGDSLTYEWDFGDGRFSTDAQPVHAFDLPGIHEVLLKVRDASGASSSFNLTVSILPGGEVAAGRTRTLDAVGLPLTGVTITEWVDGAGSRTYKSGANSGFASLGLGTGEHTWRFSKPGHLTVWRRAALDSGRVTVVPNPWMPVLNTETVDLSILGRTDFADPTARVQVGFPPGSFEQTGMGSLTLIGPQTLPFPLPRGWSPLAAFHVQTPHDPVLPGEFAIKLPAAIPSSTSLLIARFDPEALHWTAESLLPGNGNDSLQGPLSGSGSYSILIPDQNQAPPAVVVGEPIQSAGATDPDYTTVRAVGEVKPSTVVASTNPQAVTVEGSLEITAGTGVPSGFWLPTRIDEIYTLADNRALRTPDYDTTVFAYAGGNAEDGHFHSSFAMRPQLLFGPADLDEARVRADVFAPEGYQGVLLDENGGVLARNGVRVIAPSGTLEGLTAAEILDARLESFLSVTGDYAPVKAFQLNLTGITASSTLKISFAPLVANAHYALTRLIIGGGEFGLEPVLRMASGEDGIPLSIEPANGPHLQGLNKPGQYVLLQLPGPLGLVEGTVSDASGNPAKDVSVRLENSPFTTVTDGEGRYQLLAPPGSLQLLAYNPTTELEGSVEATLPGTEGSLTLDFSAAPSGPRVLSVRPADKATGVATVDPVAVTFSKGVKPATFGPAALTLVADGETEAVPGTLGLNLAGTEATFLATNPLQPGTTYRILLAGTIQDNSGRPIEGPLTYSFTTQQLRIRAAGAQLVVYEPGARNVPQEILDQLVGYAPGPGSTHVIAHGSTGTADPEVPVILVNEFTGETATVLSNPDGSFASFINAAEEDFISAVFINANDTRISIPATRQLFDDGRQGLYRFGGILEAESDGGPVQVFIEPESIEERVTFEIKALDLDVVLDKLGTPSPPQGQPLGAISVAHDPDEEVTAAADISFPINRSDLQLAAGIERPEDATFLLTRAVETLDGTIVYEIIDTMELEGDRLVTRSPPYAGLLFQKVFKKLLKTSSSSFKKLNTSNKLLNAMGLPGIQETVTHQLLLPFMMTIGGVTTDIIGNVKAAEADENGNVIGTPLPIIGATVAWNQPPYPEPGKFQAGTFVAQSRAPNGYFVMKADITLSGLGYRLRATHPRFPNQVAVATNQIGSLAQRLRDFDIYKTDLLFLIPPPSQDESGEDTTPPTILASHAPYLPDALSPTNLLIISEDDRKINTVEAVVLEARDRNGELLLESDYSLLFVENLLQSDQRHEDSYTLEMKVPGRAIVRISASDSGGNLTEVEHVVDFGRAPVFPPDPDSEDILGPYVYAAWPPNAAENIAPFPEIWLVFSEPIPESFFLPGSDDWLTFASDHEVISMIPSEDRREVRIRITGPVGDEVSLSIGSPLTDQSDNAFDQNPGEDDNQSFNYAITIADEVTGQLDIANGGGIVGAGVHLFALERGPAVDSELVIYDISDPEQPHRIASFGVPDNPKDLVYIPEYWLQKQLGDEPVLRNLVAVTGGTNGGAAPGEAIAAFKWLWIIDVTDPASPFRLASSIISQDPQSLIVKLVAAPPLLAYQEISGDVTSIHLVDIPAFVIGQNATAEEKESFPENHTPGIDLNRDGDFADAGESVSLPARAPATYYGEFFSFAPLSPRERIVDFTVGEDGGFFAITYHSDSRDSRFVSILETIGTLDETKGSLTLEDVDAKRVFTLKAIPLVVEEELRLRDLALVSVRSGAPEITGLAVLDISDLENPVLLGYMSLPEDAGIPQSIVRRADGYIGLAMSNDLLVIDPQKILDVNLAGDSLALIQRIPQIGSGARNFVSGVDGLHAVSLGARNTTYFTGPSYAFVTFNRKPEKAEELAALPLEEIRKILDGAIPMERLTKTRVTFEEIPDPSGSGDPQLQASEPLPADHYYIVVNAPGSSQLDADPSLPLLLAAVTDNHDLPTHGDGSTLPGLLVDQETIDAMAENSNGEGSEQQDDPNDDPQNNQDMPFPAIFNAFRLSQDPGHPFYNQFLAGPFTLHTSLTENEARTLTEQLERTFLRTNRRVLVGVPPRGGQSILDPFRARDESGAISLGAHAVIPTEYTRNPLIYIPGVMGSVIHKTSDESDLWIPSLANSILNILGFFNPMEALILQEDNQNEVFAGDTLRGVVNDEIDIQNAFLRYIREDLDYGEYTWNNDDKTVNINALKPQSDEGEPDWNSLSRKPYLFPFPYDWRLDNAENAKLLKSYVDLIKQAHPEAEKVDIIAHSMGGLLARNFILNNPGEVENFISIATPFLGAAKAIGTMKTGDLDDFSMNLILPVDLSLKISRNMPALHQLMPNKGMFDVQFFPLVESGWDLDGNGRYFDKLDYDQYKATLDGKTDGSGNTLRRSIYFDDSGEFDMEEPKPIETNHEPFHVPDDPKQYDWRNDDTGVNYYHIVALQQMPRTIGQLEAYPSVRLASEDRRDIGLSFPPLRFIETNQVEKAVAVYDEDADLKLIPGSWELALSLRPRRTTGDGTVPIISAVRGYGSENNLNAQNAVMTTIVSEGTSFAEDQAASHVDVLHHPKLLEQIGRILERGLSKTELPVLEIRINGAIPKEGESISFDVNISGQYPDETPVYVWETGDGRTLNTKSGQHVYGESGTYMLTCAVYYPNSGIGTVVSKEIEIPNAAPSISLDVDPANPKPGEPVTIRVDRADLGFGDEHSYEWTLDDVVVNTLPPETFILQRIHEQEGSYAVQVKITDDEGLTSTVGKSYTVSATASPALASAANLAAATSSPSESEPIEYVRLVVSGHDTSPYAFKVKADGSDMTERKQNVLRKFRHVFHEATGLSEGIFTIHRASVNDSSAPAKATVELTADAEVLEFNVTHVDANNDMRQLSWMVLAEKGDAVVLDLPWDQIKTATTDTIKNWTTPEAFGVEEGSAFEGDAPVALFETDDQTNFSELTSLDRISINAPELTARTLLIVDSPLEDDPSTAFDESTVVTGRPASILLGPQDVSTLPTESLGLVNRDNRNDKAIFDAKANQQRKSGSITQEDADEIKQAVRNVFNQAAPKLDKWLISRDDMWVFEQGTGASLWKDVSKSRYKKGSSDNDYELFMPVFKKGPPGSQTLPDIFNGAEVPDFERVAHSPVYMTGDWYFKPPIGITASGRELDAIPDFIDKEAYDAYLGQVAAWRYKLPPGVDKTLDGSGAGSGYFDIPSTASIGAGALFVHPLTPGQIISATLSAEVESDENLKKLLPDVSFFPYRREHFMFGVPSLEKPPPFGDDPIGDAGMGRGLLFLKWVLEGVFLPSNNFPFNQNLPRSDRELRSIVFQRLSDRKDDIALEDYEWAVLQEYGILRASSHLLMEEDPDSLTYERNVIPDYMTKRENKAMKSVGKALIRAILAKMVGIQQTRSAVFSTNPAAFEQNPTYKSFEDFIADIARENMNALGLSTEDIDKYLNAKLGDLETYDKIRSASGGVEAFIETASDFLVNSLQKTRGPSYVSLLEVMLPLGQIYEHVARKENAIAIDHGITATGNVQFPGRKDLHGLEDPAYAEYSFIINLQKRGYPEDEQAGPIEVTLQSQPGGSFKWDQIYIESGKNSRVLAKKQENDKLPFFTVIRDVKSTKNEIQTHTLSLGGGGMSQDTFTTNNEAKFNSRFISLESHFLSEFETVPEASKTRWVFRGLNLDEFAYEIVKLTELSQYQIRSAAWRNSNNIQDTVTAMANQLKSALETKTPKELGIDVFTKEDIEAMSEVQQAALYHTTNQVNSAFISTAEWAYFPFEKFLNGVPASNRYLFVMEVPVSQGFEYLPLNGGGVARINAEEGNEVTYLDPLNFNRAYVFKVSESSLLPAAYELELIDTFIKP